MDYECIINSYGWPYGKYNFELEKVIKFIGSCFLKKKDILQFLEFFCFNKKNVKHFMNHSLKFIETLIEVCYNKKIIKELIKAYSSPYLPYYKGIAYHVTLHKNKKHNNIKYYMKYHARNSDKLYVYVDVNKRYYKYAKKYNIKLYVNVSYKKIDKVVENIIKYKNKIDFIPYRQPQKNDYLTIIKTLYDNGYNIINNRIIIHCCLYTSSIEWTKCLIQRRCRLTVKHITNYLYYNCKNTYVKNKTNYLELLIKYICKKGEDFNYVLEIALKKKVKIEFIKVIYKANKNIIIDEKILNLSLYNIDIFKYLYDLSFHSTPFHSVEQNERSNLIIYNFKLINKYLDYIYIIDNFEYDLQELLKNIKYLKKKEYDNIILKVIKPLSKNRRSLF